MDGCNFNSIYCDNKTDFYSITIEKHYKYVCGLNDSKTIYGIPFGDIYYVIDNIEKGIYVRKIKVPVDAYIETIDKNCFLADRLIMEKNIYVKDFNMWYDDWFCIMAIKKNPRLITYVKHQKIEMCEYVIMKDVWNFVSILYPTYKMCQYALSKDGCLINYIDDQTTELCEIAIDNNPFSLKYVRNQTSELCKKAIDKDGFSVLAINDVNRTDMNEMYELSIFNNWICLASISNQTEDLCRYAVCVNPMALKYCNILTDEIKTLAVFNNGLSLELLDKNEQNEHICIMAVKNNGIALRYVFDQTYKICKAAVKNRPRSIIYIKDTNFITDEIINLIKDDEILAKNYYILQMYNML